MEIKRDRYLNALIRKMGNGMIKVITGLRRAGKSYLLFKLFKNYLEEQGADEDHIISIPLDDDANKKYWDPEFLSEYIRSKIKKDGKMTYVFLDEIQFVVAKENPYVPGTKIDFQTVLLGLSKIPGVDLYVTGSNSKMLSSDIATEFRGRGDDIFVSPLTYKEIADSLGDDGGKTLEKYLYYGGMPYLVNLQDDIEKTKYLSKLFSEIYIKDILDRYSIRKETFILNDLMNFLASSTGSLTNATKLANTFNSVKHVKIKSETIERYLEYFEDSFIVKKALQYDIQEKRYIDSPRKYYFSDIGLRNARLDFADMEMPHIMENVIFNEMIARDFSVRVGSLNYNFKDDSGNSKRKRLEIDFLCSKGSEKIYIQSAFDLPTKEKMEQETRGLTRLNDGFRKIVVVRYPIVPRYDDKGILYVGLQDFLKDEKYTQGIYQ